MPKRKKTQTDEESKKQRMDSQISLSTPLNITKHQQKENISWAQSDVLQLLSNIEESIPQDDYLSYSCRLEKINWENVAFKEHSSKECKDVWSVLYKQVRKFRLLGEIVKDIKALLSQNPATPNPKNPATPKKPFNSYMFFVEDKRQEVVHEHPTLQPNDVARKLGQMFRNLEPEQKAKYEQQASTARQEYLVKLQDFYDEHPELIPKKTKRSKSLQFEEGRGPPQKPKTPFELFAKMESEKEEHVKTQKCREQWNELSDKDKYFWINWAEELHEKYVSNLKEYMKNHPEYQPENVKSVLTRKESKIKEKCSGKPEKPPRAPYHLFTKMILESDQVKNINSKDLMNYVSEKWRASSEEEKKQYKVRVEQMWEDYNKKMDEYAKSLPLPSAEREAVMEETSRKIEAKVVAPREKIKMAKPEPPPPTVYKYFLTVYKGNMTPAAVWKTMPEDEKVGFRKKFNQEKGKFINLYEKYLKSLSREELEKLGASMSSAYNSSDSESETATSEED